MPCGMLFIPLAGDSAKPRLSPSSGKHPCRHGFHQPVRKGKLFRTHPIWHGLSMTCLQAYICKEYIYGGWVRDDAQATVFCLSPGPRLREGVPFHAWAPAESGQGMCVLGGARLREGYHASQSRIGFWGKTLILCRFVRPLLGGILKNAGNRGFYLS